MTPLQLQLLQFIDTYIREHGGESPSTEQMQAALGLGSKSGVCRLTDALAADGYIRKPKNRVRAIEVLRLPPAMERQPIPTPRVALHFDEDGNLAVLAEPGVAVFWVDDRMPNDRVYRQGHIATKAQIDGVIGDGPVGDSGDARQARLKVQLHHMEHGLRPVETDT